MFFQKNYIIPPPLRRIEIFIIKDLKIRLYRIFYPRKLKNQDTIGISNLPKIPDGPQTQNRPITLLHGPCSHL